MTYRQLLGDLDSWFAGGVTNAGPGVVLCRRGCGACCHGPFDISPADAELVATAIIHLDPAIRSTIRSHAAAQLGRYVELAPAWDAPWNVDAIDDDTFDRISDALADEPCPVLNDRGECLIYEARPATCRLTGLAMVTPLGDVLENVCPILHTSQAYAELNPALFDLARFEDRAEDLDAVAMTNGWVRTTVSGAIARSAQT
jgi:Fe-S-cluster containining protein